ncbi:MAG: S41 family peptidase [Acidimicrobiia bacterium]
MTQTSLKKPLAGLLGVLLMLSACVTEEIAATSSTTTSTTTASGATSTTVGGDGRVLRMVGCDPTEDEVEIVCEAYQLVRTHYVDEVSDADLAAAADRGLEDLDGADTSSELVCASPSVEFQPVCDVALAQADTSSEGAEAMVAGIANYALDPNSVYFDRQSLELVQEEQQGEIQGIGALVTAEDRSSGQSVLCSVISDTCRMLIVSTITGSPAEAADLHRDDEITAVDGEDIRGWTVDTVTATVRGPAGTDVTLSVLRDGRAFDIEITRAAVVIPVIVDEVVDNTGYIGLNLFSDNADEQFEDALRSELAQGVDSLVIDLRDNPGGLLDTSIAIASLFLPEGDVVVTESPDSKVSYPVSGNVIVPADIRVVFVVNRGSASASEVVTGVLQERGRVTVVGENTFGKNTVQQRFGLSNGGALKLTIARWLTPGGLDFGQVGITPDVADDIAAGLPIADVVHEALAASVTVQG